MRKRQIGIIGAGNLGARHLQAMALSQEAWQITVADINENALKNAKTTFERTDGAAKHEVCYVSEISSMPEKLDAVIVATASNIRRNVIEALFQHADVRYLVLEKVLFGRLTDYGAAAELLRKKQVRAFVNCPRRMYPVYEQLQRRLKDAHTMEILISGSDWGLGCNSIHMLDLIAYLAGSERIMVDASCLDPEYLQSKRPGFLEMTGTIRGSMGRCRSFAVSSYARQQAPVSALIVSDSCRIHLMEWKKELEFADASTGWEWKKNSFTLPLQSQLTHLVIEELLSEGSCRITPFEESCRLHMALQQQLIPYFEKQGIEKGLCPIT